MMSDDFLWYHNPLPILIVSIYFCEVQPNQRWAMDNDCRWTTCMHQQNSIQIKLKVKRKSSDGHLL